MFDNLLESKPKKKRAAGTTITSVIIHAGLITVAAYATASAGMEKEKQRQENIKFVEVKKAPEVKREEPKPEPPKVEKVAVVPPPKGFQVLRAPVEIPIKIPEIDLSRRVTNEEDFTGKGVAGGIAKGVTGGTPIDLSNTNQTYFEFQVEKPAAAVPGTVNPSYPEALRSAGVEGEVRLQFVVDTTGRVESGSVKVARSTNDLFASAARAAVPRMRFYPAEIGTRKVRQLVELPITFQITR
jgi:periplasmic protein TonB